MNISNNPAFPEGSPARFGQNSVKTDKLTASGNNVQKNSEESEKVQKVIEEFEGVFMSMMIKQLRETDSGEGFFPGDHSDTYGGMFDMFMGQHLARGSQTGLESLFESTTARNQLADYATGGQMSSRRSKGIEEYNNEQFRSSAAVPAAT
jgi:Rod binding domain-containing protein